MRDRQEVIKDTEHSNQQHVLQGEQRINDERTTFLFLHRPISDTKNTKPTSTTTPAMRYKNGGDG